jgi:hypothetical protein
MGPNVCEENSLCKKDAVEERQPTMIVIKEREKTSKSSQTKEGEHYEVWLKIFNQEAEQEMTVALKPTTEEEADIMEFVDVYKEIESLERRVNMQSRHIQQVKMETDGEEF